MQISKLSICQRPLKKIQILGSLFVKDLELKANIQVVYLSKTFEKNANTWVDICQRPWNKNANGQVPYLSKI
jgi:hypothetical protein